MSIEGAPNRPRSDGPAAGNPHPDGMSRRVASAARDRQLGPLPAQVPTGWHRTNFDNPAPEAHRRVDRPRRQVGRVLDPFPRRRVSAGAPMGVLGAGVAVGAVVALVLWAARTPPSAPTPAPVTVSTPTPVDTGPGRPSTAVGSGTAGR